MRWRIAMIASARFGPQPGSRRSSSALAWFRYTGSDGVARPRVAGENATGGAGGAAGVAEATSIGTLTGAPASSDDVEGGGAIVVAVAIAVAERPIQARTSRPTKMPTHRSAMGPHVLVGIITMRAQVEERMRSASARKRSFMRRA